MLATGAFQWTVAVLSAIQSFCRAAFVRFGKGLFPGGFCPGAYVRFPLLVPRQTVISVLANPKRRSFKRLVN